LICVSSVREPTLSCVDVTFLLSAFGGWSVWDGVDGLFELVKISFIWIKQMMITKVNSETVRTCIAGDDRPDHAVVEAVL